jgi:RNA polymerase sigma-70 factor (ECF subfamily)
VTTTTNKSSDIAASDQERPNERAVGGNAEHTEIARTIAKQYGGIHNLVRRKLRDRELAADLVNEAIAITLEQARQGRLTHGMSIGGYVFKVSMNLLRNHRRNSDNRLDLRIGDDGLATMPIVDDDIIESIQIQRKARKLIESLPSRRDREVIKRFYLDEEDKQKICADLRLTPLQFTQIMSRARRRMNELFNAHGHRRSDYISFFL